MGCSLQKRCHGRSLFYLVPSFPSTLRFFHFFFQVYLLAILFLFWGFFLSVLSFCFFNLSFFFSSYFRLQPSSMNIGALPKSLSFDERSLEGTSGKMRRQRGDLQAGSDPTQTQTTQPSHGYVTPLLSSPLPCLFLFSLSLFFLSSL